MLSKATKEFLKAAESLSKGTQRLNIGDPIELIEQVDYSSGMQKEQLGFELLPQGKWTIAEIISMHVGLDIQGSGSIFQPERLLTIEQLMPTACYEGNGEWGGYHAFEFGYTKKVLLECPYSENATYVIKHNWKTLSRLTKHELFQHHKSEYIRVYHSSKWRDEIIDELNRD